MARSAKLNFVRQQGFREAEGSACGYQYPALMFQPRLVGVLALLGLALQSWTYFLAFSVVLWWNALVPALNPFDALYNRLVAAPRGSPQLTPAPAPRRFAQGMAGTFMLAISIFLFLGWQVAAWAVQGLLVAALAALIFGKFCLGSYIFHRLRADATFAHRTLPWVEAQDAALQEQGTSADYMTSRR